MEEQEAPTGGRAGEVRHRAGEGGLDGKGVVDAARDPDEQFLVELGGGSHPARIEVRFPARLDARLVRRRLAKRATAATDSAAVG